MQIYESCVYNQMKERLMEAYGYSNAMELVVFEDDLGKKEFYIKDFINDKKKTLTCVEAQLILNIELACLMDLKNEILSCGR